MGEMPVRALQGAAIVKSSKWDWILFAIFVILVGLLTNGPI